MKVVFVLWTSSLVVSLFFGIGYAVYQIIEGNIPPIYI